MPKEVSHWVLAERTLDLLEQGPIRNAIEAFPHFYYLGAVIYDAAFYAIGVANVDEYLEVVLRLHGVGGEDTFEPFRAFVRSFHKDIPPEACSFLAGALTHYSSDVTFHPLVNHFSGKYGSADAEKRSKAELRHRGFEGHMDIYFSGVFARETGSHRPNRLGKALKNSGRLSRTLSALAESRATVEDMVRRFFCSEASDLPIWPLLRRHGQIQKQFFRRMLSVPLGWLGKLMGGELAVVAATFYPSGCDAEMLPFFSSPIEYTHPNTGEKIKGSVEDLAARATTMSADLINSFQNLAAQGELIKFLKSSKGASLEYGCDSAIHPEPIHFSLERPVKDLLRSPFQNS